MDSGEMRDPPSTAGKYMGENEEEPLVRIDRQAGRSAMDVCLGPRGDISSRAKGDGKPDVVPLKRRDRE